MGFVASHDVRAMDLQEMLGGLGGEAPHTRLILLQNFIRLTRGGVEKLRRDADGRRLFLRATRKTSRQHVGRKNRHETPTRLQSLLSRYSDYNSKIDLIDEDSRHR